jgi:DNA-binding NarL/FixJ family response regulator
MLMIKLLIASHDAGLSTSFDTAAPVIRCRTVAPEGLVAALAAAPPDVLLLDACSSIPKTLSMLSDVRQCAPALRVLLLVVVCGQDLLTEAVRRGASGCLLRSSRRDLWVKAVRAVHGGEAWFNRDALLSALHSTLHVPQSAVELDGENQLTPRERQILDLIGTGLSNKEIARRLAISDKTVKTHLHRTYVKLHQSGRYKAFLARLPTSGSPASGWLA